MLKVGDKVVLTYDNIDKLVKRYGRHQKNRQERLMNKYGNQIFTILKIFRRTYLLKGGKEFFHERVKLASTLAQTIKENYTI